MGTCGRWRGRAGCWGSGCVVTKLHSGTVLVACHFPIDFKNGKERNLVGKAASALGSLLDSYGDSQVYGFGDLNTIEGVMRDSVIEELEKKGYKLTDNCRSFLPSYYDEITGEEAKTFTTELTEEVINSFSY